MNASLKKALKIIIPIALGIFLVWYSYTSTSPEDRSQIVHYIKNASPFWVGLSIIIGILSHVSRAIRWNYLLRPLGYSPKLINNILIILISYFANLGIPRSGEILRATALTTYENVPFEKGFGTIVTERVIDLIMLLLIIIVAMGLHTEIILEFLNNSGISLLTSGLLLFSGIVGLIIFLFLIRKSSSGLALKLKNFLKGLLDGVSSILKMEKKWPFILHTFLIWGCYLAMFWVIKFTVAEVVDLSMTQLLVPFVGGAFAMMATPGGLGAYPIAVENSLLIFGISESAGNAFGWIMWVSQTLMIVVFGAISFLLLPLLNRSR